MAINTDYTQASNTTAADAPKTKVGRFTMAGTALTAADHIVQAVGFTPRYIAFENVTDRIKVEWYEGMADDTCIKTAAAGTRTLETTNKGLTVCDSDGTANPNGRYFKVSQNATLAVINTSDVMTWIAHG